MNYPEKFKQGFIKQIEKELNKCEIIYNPNTKGIWFVNREEKYWYLEYKIETNYLWWRYEFFKLLTDLFSMPSEVFIEVISKWVEDTLNCKVLTTNTGSSKIILEVEDTLNCKVLTTESAIVGAGLGVEETLNCEVLSTWLRWKRSNATVEETLNLKVDKTSKRSGTKLMRVENTLNCQVVSKIWFDCYFRRKVEETLNLK